MADKNFTYEDFIGYQNVSRETFSCLELYVELLKKWQKTINLISPSTLPQIWIRHIIDSTQLIKYMNLEKDNVADIGSGAGFPGLVLAILGVRHVTLIESDTRKVAFLREVARQVNTHVNIVNQRVEQVSLRDFSTITARAFAPLKHILDIVGTTLKTSSELLLLKGKNNADEIEGAQKDWMFNWNSYPSLTERDGVVLQLTQITQRS